ncbi:MAG: DEAD/DEAH box helicase family protein, partial [Succinivibrionaceae bacterium]
MDILPLSEEDVKARYITPALEKSGWSVTNNVRMEYPISDGQILLKGNLVHREKPKKADYILFCPSHKPMAIVEAKSQKVSVGYGIQQAIEYAKKMDIPFAYSSNGLGFVEHDFLTGTEREIPLQEFPSPEELLRRFKKNYNDGLGLSAEEENLINEPYYTNVDFNEPRYYQRVAIDRVLSAVAKGQDRLLLVMATGTGKTFTAFQIIYRLLKSKTKNRVLYLADRNILVDQSLAQDFKPL